MHKLTNNTSSKGAFKATKGDSPQANKMEFQPDLNKNNSVEYPNEGFFMQNGSLFFQDKLHEKWDSLLDDFDDLEMK